MLCGSQLGLEGSEMTGEALIWFSRLERIQHNKKLSSGTEEKGIKVQILGQTCILVVLMRLSFIKGNNYASICAFFRKKLWLYIEKMP